MGRGNRYRQHQRRKERFKSPPPRRPTSYQCIDGNFSYYPILFCIHYRACLTEGLLQLHRCRKRHCKNLRRIDMGNVNYYILHYFESWGKDSSGEPMGRTHSEFIWATPKRVLHKRIRRKLKGDHNV